MEQQTSGCAGKAPMRTWLAPYEKKLICALVPHFPKWAGTQALTLMTIPWSAGLILCSWMAGRTGNLHWLWGASAMMFLQWFTDCFDGAVGRYRNTGLIKWGFYMDHFLDFVFMCSVFVGWSFLFDETNRLLLWFMSLGMGCLMVSAFLSFGATNEFKITYLGTGPTEMRLYFILLNAAITLFGVGWVKAILVYVFCAFWLMIGVVVFRTQKYIYGLDMKIKAEQERAAEQAAEKIPVSTETPA